MIGSKETWPSNAHCHPYLASVCVKCRQAQILPLLFAYDFLIVALPI